MPVTVTQSARLLLDDLTSGLVEEWARRSELYCGSNRGLNAYADERDCIIVTKRTYASKREICAQWRAPLGLRREVSGLLVTP